MKAAAITALSSGQGKTLFTMALMQWLKQNAGSVQPFKVGPDYIDPLFHKKITGVDSVNLDVCMMSEQDIKNTFAHYSQRTDFSVVEGVMGFYDGIDYGSSTYEATRIINIPTILIISAEGSYATLVPILKGVLEYRQDNTIHGVVLNKVSSEMHFKTIEKQLKKELPELKILGWIQKGLDIISSRHLGLDLTELDNEKVNEIAEKVMQYIDTPELLRLMEIKIASESENSRFMCDAERVREACKEKQIAIVCDEAFSFVYKQNIDFFEKFFRKVYRVSAMKDEEIPHEADVVYIPGGYVETPEVASVLEKANRFKSSLKAFSDNPHKKIYAECAGLMFLGEKIQTTEGGWINGTGILPMSFKFQKKRNRLGYYKAIDKDDFTLYKGHAFHYSCPFDIKEGARVKWGLFKPHDEVAKVGAWTNEKGNVIGTYLHSFFYNQPELVLRYMIEEYYEKF